MVPTASDDEDETLAQFLESEVLNECSDQEEKILEEDEDKGSCDDEETEEGKVVKRTCTHQDDYHVQGLNEQDERVVKKSRLLEDEDDKERDEGQEEEDNREVKRMKVKEEEEEEEEHLKALLPPSPSSSGDCELKIEVEGEPMSLLLEKNDSTKGKGKEVSSILHESRPLPRRMETGILSIIPSELLYNILKFLSSEDLVACSLVCRFLNYAASDESLWRRLYCLRWGLLTASRPRECAWKKLYIQRDAEDMVEFVRNSPSEFKEYYIQMQAAKRSQAPLPSQVNDDRIILDTILDKTVADQISLWKKSRGLSDIAVVDHACSGETCTYYQLGDVFVCEQTGHVHVCDDTCREVVADPANELLVCTISGHCFDRLLSPSEIEPDVEQQLVGATDEAEPFMGSGRFARAYLLGYNCDDEKELEACLRFC